MKRNLRAVFPIGPAVMILLLILLASAALLRESRLRDKDLARLGALEAITEIAADFIEGNDIEIPSGEISGWGIYYPDGRSVIVTGSAPQDITFFGGEDIRGGGPSGIGWESIEGGNLRSIRSMTLSEAAADTGMHSRRGLGMRRLILVDWNLQSNSSRSFIRYAGIVGLALSAAALLVLQQRSAGKLARYQAEEERQRRLVQLGMAARTLTHEIRNPLGILKGQQALLKRKLPAGYEENLTIINDEIIRLSQLTDRVRDWLSDPKGHPEPLDTSKVLSKIVEGIPYPVELETPEPGPVIRMDRLLFASVMENLLNNAQESQEGNANAAPPQVTLKVTGRRLQISIQDRGRGLPDVEHERLFDPFFTTKITGSGVGLAHSRQAVEAVGGTLNLERRNGGGSRALVELPITQDGNEGI